MGKYRILDANLWGLKGTGLPFIMSGTLLHISILKYDDSPADQSLLFDEYQVVCDRSLNQMAMSLISGTQAKSSSIRLFGHPYLAGKMQVQRLRM